MQITNYANPQGGDMNWTTPAYTELRLGFEITMYIANR
jgi:pyrroloquinoline quinone biosynthesis protein A